MRVLPHLCYRWGSYTQWVSEQFRFYYQFHGFVMSLLWCRMSSMDCLPEDVMFKILELLSARERVQAALVSKWWKSVCLKSWRTMTFHNIQSNQLGKILKWLKAVSSHSNQTLCTLRIRVLDSEKHFTPLLAWPGTPYLLCPNYLDLAASGCPYVQHSSLYLDDTIRCFSTMSGMPIDSCKSSKVSGVNGKLLLKGLPQPRPEI